MTKPRPHHLEQAARDAEAAFLRDTYRLETRELRRLRAHRIRVHADPGAPLPDSLIPRTEEER